MGRLTQLTDLVIPKRASTQTWMMLTFVLFVGFAVGVVSIYAYLALRGKTGEATRQMLSDQAERIVLRIEETTDPDDRLAIARELSRLSDLRITAVREGTVLWDLDGGRPIRDGSAIHAEEMQVSEAEPILFATRTGTGGRTMLYAAYHSARSGLVIRVGQPQPLLVSVVHTLQFMLVASMVLAMLFALAGSWVASKKIIGPLQVIKESARRIAEGELGKRIEVESRAVELHVLAMSLNRMSQSFKQQIKTLQRLARLQNEFIGNVGHEVRNPIFAVSGYLEALGSNTLSPETRKRYVRKGLTNLQRLDNLFSDLIEIARLESRENLIQPDVFDLSELVLEIGETLQPKVDGKGLQFEMDNPSLHVLADRNRIRQVLTNLIDNAIAYTDEGTIRCRSFRRRDKVRVEVIDTGRGIPEEHLERIFDRFYRVDPHRSRGSGGTGLGLSIARQILQAHNEAIHVESTCGRETKFWFDLPFAEAPEPGTL